MQWQWINYQHQRTKHYQKRKKSLPFPEEQRAFFHIADLRIPFAPDDRDFCDYPDNDDRDLCDYPDYDYCDFDDRDFCDYPDFDDRYIHDDDGDPDYDDDDNNHDDDKENDADENGADDDYHETIIAFNRLEVNPNRQTLQSNIPLWWSHFWGWSWWGWFKLLQWWYNPLVFSE